MTARSTVVNLVTIVGVGLASVRAGFADAPPREGHLKVAGTVLMPDGSPAADAMVSCVNGDVELGKLPMTRTDRLGRFELRDEFGFGCRLHARSADEIYQTTLLVSPGAARTRLAKPVELKLTRARELVVSVTCAGKPVDRAHVVAVGAADVWYRVDAQSGADGKAKLLVPSEGNIEHLAAWHPELGVDGLYDADKGIQGETVSLSLRATRPHTLRAVDAEGHAVPNLKLAVHVRIEEVGWIMTGDVEAAALATGADGKATVPWFPREHVPNVEILVIDPEWKLDGQENDPQQGQAGPTTVYVRRKIAVPGRLKMPPGASAEGILVSGFGFAARENGDVPAARARADGSFTLRVAADHGYALGIIDSDWASDGWTGLVLPNDAATPATIELDVYAATPLEVRASHGPQHEPIANAWVNLSVERDINWHDALGKRHSAEGGPSSWLRTDARGKARTGVGKGEQHLRFSSGNWQEERTVEIKTDAPVSVEFYRPWLTMRKVIGRPMLDKRPHKPSPSSLVHAATVEGAAAVALKPVVRPDGNIEVEADADQLSLFVLDREEHLSGFARVGIADTTVDVLLSPTAVYGGIAVDKAGHPVVGKALQLLVEGAKYPAAEEQVTDDQGRFRFDAVATNVPLRLAVREPTDSGQFSSTRRRFFVPGESRDDTRLVLEISGSSTAESSAKLPRPARPLADRLADVTRDVRLAGMHVLVVLKGDSSEHAESLSQQLLDYEEVPEVLGYLPLVVGPKTIETETATLKKLGWQPPAAGEIVLLAIDGAGMRLGHQTVTVGEGEAALELCKAFIKQHVPQPRDSKARLAAAQAEAKRSGRRVWVVESGSRCGPCFALARWMDDHHALLEKDYVIIKLSEDRDTNTEEVLAPMRPIAGGIPWIAITEPDGAVLATSDGPLGNIGLPSSFEGVRHFREMLGRTAQRLNAEELDGIAKSLRSDDE